MEDPSMVLSDLQSLCHGKSRKLHRVMGSSAVHGPPARVAPMPNLGAHRGDEGLDVGVARRPHLGIGTPLN